MISVIKIDRTSGFQVLKKKNRHLNLKVSIFFVIIIRPMFLNFDFELVMYDY